MKKMTINIPLPDKQTADAVIERTEDMLRLTNAGRKKVQRKTARLLVRFGLILNRC